MYAHINLLCFFLTQSVNAQLLPLIHQISLKNGQEVVQLEVLQHYFESQPDQLKSVQEN